MNNTTTTICPTGTNTFYTGGPHNVFTKCKCPYGTTFNGTICVQSCQPDQITIDQVNKGIPSGGRINRSCFCPPGYGWDPYNNKCVSCYLYADALLTNSFMSVPSVPFGIIGCDSCNIGDIWMPYDNSCNSCPIGASKTKSSVPTPGFPGCYCDPTLVWDDYNLKCVSNYNNCPLGSSNINTNDKPPIPNYSNCYCNFNRVWDPTTLQCLI